MATATMKTTEKRVSPWGRLPAHMKVLYITTLHRTGGWLAEAFTTDSASEIELEEAIGVTAGLAQLRNELFDAIVVSHEPGVLDALDLIEGLRAGGSEEPMIVLSSQDDQDLAALCYEVGADAYCNVKTTTTRTLIWSVALAIQRNQLLRENRRLVQAERQRLEHEHREAERLLDQQRALISDLVVLQGCGHVRAIEDESALSESGGESGGGSSDNLALPDRLVAHYREMLRAYVVMGTGNLTDEMTTLAGLLASAGVSAQQTIHLHICVLEELIRGLGTRSARHVMNRADLLVLEVMVHLAEGYRKRYLQRLRPALQLPLPGFDDCASNAF